MKLNLAIILISLSAICFGQETIVEKFEISEEWQSILDKELSNWELFVGVPHTSVELEGHPKSDNVHVGTPLGLNNDPKKVMTTKEENGEILLKITGEIYAGLTSLQEFENYHLKVQFKWGNKKWEPRLDKKMDNGILYHCHGEHGAFWNVWMSGLECQIQEGDMGDFVSLVNARATVKSTEVKKGFMQVTGKKDKAIEYGGKGNPGYCHIYESNENAMGEWSTVEVLCVGDQSIHVVNGKVVMLVRNARKEIDGKMETLTKGKIQLQSEGAEAYYKDIQIKTISKYPKAYKKQAKQL